MAVKIDLRLDNKDFNKKLKGSSQEVEKTSKKINASQKKLSASLNKYSKTNTSVIGKVSAKMKMGFTKIDASVKKTQARMKTASIKMKASFQRMGSGVAKFKTQIGVAVAALTALAYASSKAVQAYGVQEAAEKSLGQALENTGSKVPLSTLTKYASSLQKVTKFGDEAILASQALLVTLGGNFAEATLRKATTVMLDFSAVMGTDAKASALILGKALGDPIRNVTLLSRYGISFTKQETEKIKVLTESNKKHEAQDLILEKLNKKFKGQARLAATGAGVLTQVSNAFGDVQEAVGKYLLPSFALISKSLLGFAQGEGLDNFIKKFSKIAFETYRVASFLYGELEGVVGFFKTSLVSAVQALTGAGFAIKHLLVGDFGKAKDALKQIGTDITDNFKTFGKELEENARENREMFAKSYEERLADQAAHAEQKKVINQTEIEEEENQTSLLTQVLDKRQKDLSALRANFIQEEITKSLDQGAQLTEAQVGEIENRYNRLTEKELEKIQERRALMREQQLLQKEEDAVNQELDLSEKIAAAEGEERAKLESESSTFKNLEKEKRTNEIKAKKQESKDLQTRGKAWVSINKTLNSDKMKVASTFFDSYATLSQSSDKRLKAIGKVAQIAQITLNGATSAFNIFSKVAGALAPNPAAVPIGIAAAAPVLVQQGIAINQVARAQEGGTVQRAFGTPVVGDFQNILAEPNEVILPKDDVNLFRKSSKLLLEGGEDDSFFSDDNNSMVEIIVDQDASSIIEAQNIKNRSLGIGVFS